MLIHDYILSRPEFTVGSTIQGFKITRLDRANKVVELEKVQTLLPTDGKEGQLVTLLADKTFGLTDPVKITIQPKDLLSGVGIPADTLGDDGQFFLQLDAKLGDFEVWGAKTGGKWPASAQYAKTPDLAPKITALETKTAATDTALDQRISALELKKSELEVKFNRLPTNTDIYREGTVWLDESFGVTTPLRLVSMGNGVWAYLNQISLTKIRVNVSGRNTSYRSTLNALRFLRPDGTQIPNSWFVWGNGSAGIGKGGTGVAYNGGTISSNYTSGWVELEVSGLFDHTVLIGSAVGNYNPDGTYFNVNSIEFWYSNGSKKVFAGTGWQTGANITACTVDPALVCKYGDSIAAAQGEMLTAAKLADATNNDFGRVSGAVFDSAYNSKAAPLTDRVVKLEARKEVKDGLVTTVLMDGKTLIDNGQRPSGFNNDGTGDVAGATSWNAWNAVGIPVSGSGLPDDVYEISAGFPAAASFADITVYIGGDSRKITQTGLQAGALDAREWSDGDWRGITVTVKGDFTGSVAFVGFNGNAYIGPVVRKTSADGFTVDGKALALKSDIQGSVDLTGLALKSEIPSLAGYDKTEALRLLFTTYDWANSQLDDINAAVNSIPDRFQAKGDYALKTDVQASQTVDLTGYATKEGLSAEAKARADADAAIYTTITNYNEILFQHQEELAAEVTARTDADTVLDGRIDSIESNMSAAKSARLVTSAGVWATFGTLQFTMAASGNRSFQIRSVSGTISVVVHSWTGWDSTSYPFSASITTTSKQYLNPAYGYGNTGNNQFFWIEDVTNNRRYEGVATVGSAYNNNVIWVKEVT